ncbi:MAG: hypothetical protein ACKO15_07405 [Burkholderiales bacterium]
MAVTENVTGYAFLMNLGFDPEPDVQALELETRYSGDYDREPAYRCQRMTLGPPKPWQAWRGTFPLLPTSAATEHLAQTWAIAIRAYPDKFRHTERENRITEFLWSEVAKSSLSARLTGKWTYEDPNVIFDAKRKGVIKRVRSDITYLSDKGDVTLFLVYEFKKLRDNDTSRKTYQDEDGMMRFVNGYYSVAQPLAAVVGMIIGEPANCIDALKRSLIVPGVRSSLFMVPDNSQYVRTPSTTLVPVAQFDTEHRRPTDQAPGGNGTTTLAHIFFALPKLEG